MGVLGISTNTRLLGLAIITEDGLADYSIRLYKTSWSPSKANLMITSLEPCVRQYCIKKVVLSIPPTHYQTEGFPQLIKQLTSYFTEKNIAVHTEPDHVLQNLCQHEGRKTKKAIMQSLVELFPELRLYYNKEMRNKNKYYVKLFEAVGMAALHSQVE